MQSILDVGDYYFPEWILNRFALRKISHPLILESRVFTELLNRLYKCRSNVGTKIAVSL